jgi:DNA-binding MarR family transcriptional regulator
MGRRDERQSRLEAIGARLREVTRLSLRFSEAMASELGVSVTDLECLDRVALGANVTAGALAEATGLTTGAITGAIDRLERAGFVERRRDDADRRKVIVAGTPATRRPHPSSARMRRAVASVLQRYDDEQLSFLERALGDLCGAAQVVIGGMCDGEKPDAGARPPAKANQRGSARSAKSARSTPRAGR